MTDIYKYYHENGFYLFKSEITGEYYASRYGLYGMCGIKKGMQYLNNWLAEKSITPDVKGGVTEDASFLTYKGVFLYGQDTINLALKEFNPVAYNNFQTLILTTPKPTPPSPPEIKKMSPLKVVDSGNLHLLRDEETNAIYASAFGLDVMCKYTVHKWILSENFPRIKAPVPIYSKPGYYRSAFVYDIYVIGAALLKFNPDLYPEFQEFIKNDTSPIPMPVTPTEVPTEQSTEPSGEDPEIETSSAPLYIEVPGGVLLMGDPDDEEVPIIVKGKQGKDCLEFLKSMEVFWDDVDNTPFVYQLITAIKGIMYSDSNT